jgi:hypothetical protein
MVGDLYAKLSTNDVGARLWEWITDIRVLERNLLPQRENEWARIDDYHSIQLVISYWTGKENTWSASVLDEQTRALALIDIVGNPFAPMGRFDAEIVTPQVVSLAKAVRDNLVDGVKLDQFRLALLSDAMEEAGFGMVKSTCNGCRGKGQVFWTFDAHSCVVCSPNLKTKGTGYVMKQHPAIEHLRSGRTHFRYCHVLRLLLEGKEVI